MLAVDGELVFLGAGVVSDLDIVEAGCQGAYTERQQQDDCFGHLVDHFKDRVKSGSLTWQKAGGKEICSGEELTYSGEVNRLMVHCELETSKRWRCFKCGGHGWIIMVASIAMILIALYHSSSPSLEKASSFWTQEAHALSRFAILRAVPYDVGFFLLTLEQP